MCLQGTLLSSKASETEDCVCAYMRVCVFPLSPLCPALPHKFSTADSCLEQCALHHVKQLLILFKRTICGRKLNIMMSS